MDQVFRRLVENRFSDLSGSAVSATIAVPESLINDTVRAALQGNKSIHSLQIAVHSQNRISLNVKTTLLPWALQLKLRIDRSIDLASYSSPKLRAWMESNRWLGSLGSLFNALPEAIKLYGDQIVVDLGSFLPTPEHRRMLELVKAVEIRTQESMMILDVQAAVDA